MPTLPFRAIPRTGTAPLAALLCLAALLLSGTACVPAARHQKIHAELERIRARNLELQRDLAEQRVRLLEMAEAGSPSRAAGMAAPAAPVHPSAEAAVEPAPAAPSKTPAAVLGHPAGSGIQEETIREPGPKPAETGAGGERILWVARKYSREGQISESISAYSRFIQDFPFSPLLPDAFVERARARLKTGDRSGALDDYRTVAEAFPGSPLAPEARREADRLGGS